MQRHAAAKVTSLFYLVPAPSTIEGVLLYDDQAAAAAADAATNDLNQRDRSLGEWHTWTGPGGVFHDSASARLSIIGKETLGAWPVRRFRPNVLVSGGAEDSLVASSVRIGVDVVLDVSKRIDRCVMITRPQPDGIERDLDVLRTVNGERQSCVGVSALVRSNGEISVGDDLVTL